jgi:hypothetical protein
LPCVQCSAAAYIPANSFTSINQPWTFSTVVNRTSGTSDQGIYGVSSGPVIYFHTANTLALYAGNVVSASATDGTTHAYQAIGNGASSVLYIDGSSNTVNAGTNVAANNSVLCNNPSQSAPMVGNLFEVGIWPVGFSGGNNSSMNSNQHTYWGF